MSINLSKEGYPIKFQSVDQRVAKTFDSAEAVRQFIRDELSFWSTLLEQVKASGVPLNEASRLVNQAGRAILRQANSVIGDATDFAAVTRALGQIGTSNAVLSEGTFGRMLRSIGDRNPPALAGTVYAASRSLVGHSTPSVDSTMASLIDLDLVARGLANLALKANSKAEQAALDDLAQRLSDQLLEIQGEKENFDQWVRERREAVETALGQMEATTSDRLDNVRKLASVLESEVRDTSSRLMSEFQRTTVLALDESRRAISELTERTTRDLSRIESVYVSKQVLKGPSELWKAVSVAASRAKWGYFAMFALLVLAPLAALLNSWTPVVELVKSLAAQSTTGFSLTGIAVLTIPALAYGWLLRHVSRLFIHNLTLQSDAQYREVLSKTFLGLADQNVTGITEAERALVLNALFRPTPPHSADDGPPSGILELIKK